MQDPTQPDAAKGATPTDWTIGPVGASGGCGGTLPSGCAGGGVGGPGMSGPVFIKGPGWEGVYEVVYSEETTLEPITWYAALWKRIKGVFCGR